MAGTFRRLSRLLLRVIFKKNFNVFLVDIIILRIQCVEGIKESIPPEYLASRVAEQPPFNINSWNTLTALNLLIIQKFYKLRKISAAKINCISAEI